MRMMLLIRSNEGYSPDAVRGLKVGTLKEMLEDLDDDMEIVTKDINNKYGANFGIITTEIEEYYEDDDE